MTGLLLSLIIAVAAREALSKCPTVKPMADFEDNDLIGQWYLLAQTNSSGSSSSRQHCQTMFVKKNPKEWQFEFTGVDASDNKVYKIKSTGIETKNAVFDLKSHGPNSRRANRSNLVVLGSDKKDFVVLFNCQFPEPNNGYLWIYSRSKRTNLSQLSQSEQAAIGKVLADNDFSPFDLEVLDNSSCSTN